MHRKLIEFVVVLSVVFSVPLPLRAEGTDGVQELLMLSGVSSRFTVDGVNHSTTEASYYNFKSGRSMFMFGYQGHLITLAGEEDRVEGSTRYILNLDRMTFGSEEERINRVLAKGKCVLDLREDRLSFALLRCMATSSSHLVTIELKGDMAPIKVMVREGEVIDDSEAQGDQAI